MISIPPFDTFTVTYKQILDAIVENGFHHIRESWFDFDSADGTTIVSACLLGQGALNLETKTYEIERALNRIEVRNSRIPKALREESYEEGSASLGELLISMNDFVADNGKYVYSWKQLVNFATTHIKPHFEEEVIIQRKVWSYKKIDS